ncbi:type I 3-dehydroquinate dehydratase [Cellulosilyticum sp. WCF-2]|uniref:type I 3-dehydroquinate dehydratase n=1 Tax=Cellulosilyticum sp. WCF-2 TaxID=2497860 RepID=UPI000F8CDF76|nr:type I 3-dehydroquinate dehydratase [Cellulosilyticum sp. WCF-2]QEH67968.1 type I 3-dehydroquinate dehydratase [Cellulosilyticum sp. WCF-2]
MKQIVEVRNVKFGEGMPKICVPLIGKNNKELIEEANFLKTLNLDVVEWRIDHHQEVEDIDQMKESLKVLREALGDLPLLVTFRSKKEGGEREVSIDYYAELNKAMAETGMADMIDVELFTGDEIVKEIVDFAHSKNVKVVMSNHDFFKTPAKEEIISRLCKMQEMNADLPKIAVMPQTTEDVLTLLSATNEMVTKHADRPIITISMAGLGVISRLAGEAFGSALTFGAAKAASAPGQVPVEKLAQVLEILHESK